MKLDTARKAACLAATLTAGLLRAQTSVPAAEQAVTPTTTLTARSTLVAVPALVRARGGELVYTLTADDFVLTDDGVPQPLKLEPETGGEPLALVVLLEANAAMRGAGWHPYRKGDAPDRFRTVPTMVEALVGGVPHRIGVVGFDSQPELELGLTADMGAVTDAILEFSEKSVGDGGAAILDSLSFALDLLRKAPVGYRRAILLLSETNDRGSTIALDDAVRALGETNTAIYSVVFSTGFHEASEYGNKQLPTKGVELRRSTQPASPTEVWAERVVQGMLFGVTLHNPYPNPPRGCMGVDPDTDPSAAPKVYARAYDCLAQLAPPLAVAKMAATAATGALRMNVPKTVARLTGGEYFIFNDAKSLEADLATLANHIPNRYMLSFQPKSPHPGMHILGLQMRDRPGLTVTARSAYWAEAPADSR